MKKQDIVHMLEQQLRAVKAERQAAKRDPALLAARTALKQYQSARLAATHADLLAAPGTRQAALFFLNELYGSQDLSQRDADLERIVPTMQRVLPLHALQTVTEAIVLDALSERLDTAMARVLGLHFGEREYIQAYRAQTLPQERERQLTLVAALGTSLCELVKVPFLAATLSLMRGPARLAGLGELQCFLEHGFCTFRQMDDAAAFVATIVGREQRVMQHIYDGRPQPFALDCA